MNMNAHVITLIETGLKSATTSYIRGIIDDDENTERMIAYNMELKNEQLFADGKKPVTYVDFNPKYDGKAANANRW